MPDQRRAPALRRHQLEGQQRLMPQQPQPPHGSVSFLLPSTRPQRCLQTGGMLQASPLKSRDAVSDPVRISSARHAADAFHVGLGLLAALLRSSLAATASSMAGTADTEIMRAPISDTRYNPCVDEFATTTGIVHVVQHTTTTQNGVTRTFSYVHQGMTGTGLLSGARYVETHVENQSSYLAPRLLPWK
jgi:hypothetical protein